MILFIFQKCLSGISGYLHLHTETEKAANRTSRVDNLYFAMYVKCVYKTNLLDLYNLYCKKED